jgi:hypothetical protein
MPYECEESKQWEKEKPKKLLPLCCYCFKFMREADACLEDSVLTPLAYTMGLKTKPTIFHPNDNVPKEVIEFHSSFDSKTTMEKNLNE